MKKHLSLSSSILLPLILMPLILLQSACGWHLRGTQQTDLNIDSVYLIADNSFSSTFIEMKRALEINQIKTPELASNADYSIALNNERQSRRAVSVGNDALVTEYELTLSLDYRIANKNGDILVPTSTAEVVRSYEFDRNAMVAKSEEEELILSEMQSTLIQQILRQLRFVSQADTTSTVNSGDINGQTAP